MAHTYYNNHSYFGMGTTQNSRLLKALRPSYIKLDDRELPELLAFLKEYAQLINFYNTDNRVDGDWESFFTHDISVILATIISIDLEGIEAKHNNIIAAFHREHGADEKLEQYVQLMEHTYMITAQFDDWYRQIRAINFLETKFETIIEAELYGVIYEKVKLNIQRLKAISLGAKSKAAFGRSFGLSFDAFDDFWDLENVAPENVYKGESESEKLHSGLLQCRLLYRSLHQALSYTVFHFKKYFYKSLNDKNNHHPNIGLIIGFLQLFQHHQTSFNRLTDRYLHYYYKNYLRQTPTQSHPDKVHVLLELANHAKRFELVEGTLLNAKSDENGQDIHYKVLQNSIITQAKITALKTVFISRRDDVESTNYSLVTDIFASSIKNVSDENASLNQERGWALFGEEQQYKPFGFETMDNATIGFAVASPILFLREGHRKIKIKFNFEAPSTKVLKKLLIDIQEKVSQLNPTEKPKSIEDIFYENVFNRADQSRSFKVYLTGNRGWLEADPNHINILATGNGDWSIDGSEAIEEQMNVVNSITFEFEMPASKPSVVGYNPTVIKDGDFQTSFPIVKVLINEKKQPYAYSLLKNLIISNVDIDVSVTGMRKFDLYSDFGAVDNRQPFAPFGPQPSIGSSLLIGSPETFRKKLTNLTLDIEWKDIPETVEQFRKYYKAYKLPELSPPNYQIKVSALSGNTFKPMRGDNSTLMPLFSTTSNGSTLDVTPIVDTKLVVGEDDFEKLEIEPDPHLDNENDYNNETKTGYFKIELRSPDHAFGHQIYQDVFTEIVTRNARRPQDDPDDVPKLPYTPYIKTMSLNYSAKMRIQDNRHTKEGGDKIYHIHPFGIHAIFEKGSFNSKHSYLLPQYSSDGYLYIGLQDVNPPEPISFLFQLTSQKSSVSTEQHLPVATWSYLNRNEWRDFKSQDLLYDSTDRFTKSGIVRLQLPRNLSKKNTVMESETCWLRIRIDGNTEVLSHALAVKAQAAVAEWVVNGQNKDKIRKPLSPYTITNLMERKGDVKEVIQPFESFTGRPAENNEEFFSRVSERLRHKNRAITHWDFERIILEQFQEVYQAKCLSSLSNPIPKGTDLQPQRKNLNEKVEVTPQGINHKEGLVIVVIPKTTKYLNDSTPKFNYKDLQSIERFLKKCTSPFIKLKVRNPQYEYIRVIANVKFIPGYNNGLSLKRLNKDIAQFIAPWLENEGVKINVGGSLNENVLKNFIKGLPYVKFITKFSLLHILEEDGQFKLEDTAEDENNVSIIKARPWGVLLPDDMHEMEMVEREEERPPIKRIDSEKVIRFQNRINLTGHKKYIKIKNPNYQVKKEEERVLKAGEAHTLTIKI